MDNEDSDKTNLNTVKEMILDEEKLVTYISISKDLCIHVNNSKQLLSSAVQQIRKDKPRIELNINYIISGLSANKTATTTLCAEKDLNELRKSFDTVFFYHVYSVSKGNSGVDHVALLLLNKYEDYSLCPGTIRSKECFKRTSDEIGSLKSNSQEAVVLQNKPSNVANRIIKQEPKKTLESSIKIQPEQSKANETEIKSETKIKVEVTSPKKDSNNKQSNQKTNGFKPQKGIASFFNKSNGVQSSKTTNGSLNKITTNGAQNKDVSDRPQDKLEVEKMDLDTENCENDLETKKEVITKKPKKEIEVKEEKKNTKNKPVIEEKSKTLNKIKKTSKVDKKRKRVLHVSDSEGDEENDPFCESQETSNIINNESDDEIPPTPSANIIKVTSGIVNPKKRRKVVDKTYTDEDGYILTKKEEVYESCSENEDELKKEKEIKIEKEVKKVECDVSPNKTKKNSPKKSKKKISPPQKGKQPTLNSFFNRK